MISCDVSTYPNDHLSQEAVHGSLNLFLNFVSWGSVAAPELQLFLNLILNSLNFRVEKNWGLGDSRIKRVEKKLTTVNTPNDNEADAILNKVLHDH